MKILTNRKSSNVRSENKAIPDVFILDLEDSIPENDTAKSNARNAICENLNKNQRE